MGLISRGKVPSLTVYVHEANNGAYQCLGTNQVGQGTSNTQTVNVIGKSTRMLG